MKTTIYGLLVILASCTQSPKNNPQTPTQSSDGNLLQDSLLSTNPALAKLKIEFGQLLEIDESGIVMSPLSSNGDNNDRSSFSLYKSMPFSNYWNIVFYNSNTKEYYLLAEQKMMIQNFFMNLSGEESIENNHYIDSNYILYSIVTDDYNKDGLLDNDDPTYLFATDRKGKSFRRLSPVNQHLNSWKYIRTTGKLLLKVTEDSDKNLSFDEKDQASLVAIDLKNEQTIEPILSDSFQLRLKTLFDRDWKKKKD